jgi:lipopolysaccharide biosynthesis glycosyltransferase
MNAVWVVTSADNRYARHLGVMLTSLFCSSSNSAKFEIIVLNGGISQNNVTLLRRITEKYCAGITYYNMDKYAFKNYPITEHITQAAYYRVSIPDILDNSIHKVLYLDCDIIVKEDICKLWEIDIDGYSLAAVEDPNMNRQKALFMPDDALYFNSGVMLINLKRWRNKSIGNKAHDFARGHPDLLLLHDQDALNAVLYGDWLPLHPKWNQQTKMFRLRHSETSFSDHELAEALQSPAIIHYTESSKPWHYMNEHPYKDEYYKFLQCTKWKYRFPKIQKYINYAIKPIVGSVYTLLDYLKKYRAEVLNMSNNLLSKLSRG